MSPYTAQSPIITMNSTVIGLNDHTQQQHHVVSDDTTFEVTIQVPDGKYSTEMVTTKPTACTTTTTTVSISYQPTDEFFSNNRHSLFLQMHVPVCVCILRQERVE